MPTEHDHDENVLEEPDASPDETPVEDEEPAAPSTAPTRNLLPFIVALVMALGIGIVIGSAGRGGAPDTPQHDHEHDHEAPASDWTCSMHARTSSPSAPRSTHCSPPLKSMSERPPRKH